MKTKLNLLRDLMVMILTAVSFSTSGQVLTKQWDNTIGGSRDETYKHSAAKQTLDGGYLVGCVSLSDIGFDKSENNKGIYDYWVVKLDASGNKIWDKTLGGDGTDDLSSVEASSDGGYLIGGTSTSGISGDKTSKNKGSSDYWIVKLDALGNVVWDKTFGGGATNRLYSLKQTTDGGYILAGSSDSPAGGDKSEGSRGSYDYWVLKLDAGGNKLWDKTYGGSSFDDLRSVEVTTDGGYLLGGYSSSPAGHDKTGGNMGAYDYWIVKIDGVGNKLWDKTFGAGLYDQLFSVKQTIDNGFILGGYSNSNRGYGSEYGKSEDSRGGYDYWVLRLNSSGNKIWDKTFGGRESDFGSSVDQTSDGGFVIMGQSNSNATLESDKSQNSKGYYDYWIIKMNSAGNKEWDLTLGGTSGDMGYGVAYTTDGGYFLSGFSNSMQNEDKSEDRIGGTDLWVVKLTENVAPVINSVISSGVLFPVNESVSLAVNYTDNNVIRADISWDDGNVQTISDPATTFEVSHTYASAGVYSVKVKVTDAFGLYDEYILEYLVAYDPNGGFVTGGGWIDSPEGAYAYDPTLVGKASFGFVSKYQKGANIPTGNTEFQFKAGDLNFSSISYQWLVVAGYKAQFKGVGTINGSGSYHFIITAIDGTNKDSTSPDKFRIKITEGGTVIYDNQLGESEDSEATTAIAAGSIVIHNARSDKRDGGADSEIAKDIPASVLSLYPNPVEEVIYVSFASESQAPIGMQLFDLNGRSLSTETYHANEAGQYEMPVSNLNLKTGFYLLRIAQDKSTKTIKVYKR